MWSRKSGKIIVGLVGILVLLTSLTIVLIIVWDRDISPQASAQPGAAKIMISRDGFYRIAFEELQDFGMEKRDFEEANVSLSQLGNRVPYLTDDDGLLFYGLAPVSRYSAHRPYILRLGEEGQLMDKEQAPPSEAATVHQIPNVVHYEENKVYDSNTSVIDQDGATIREPWYWATIFAADQLLIEVSIPDIGRQPLKLKLGMMGVSYSMDVENDHDFELAVNGEIVDSISWDGETYYTTELDIPAGVLRPGKNIILFDNEAPGAVPVDIMHLDWIELIYHNTPLATDDRITVDDTDGVVTVSGFSARPRFFDLSDPNKPLVLTGWTFDSGEAEIGLNNHISMVGVGPNGFLDPESILPLRSSDIKENNKQADLVIITSDDLTEALEPLLEVRREQGLSVRLINVDEIYDQFGYGQSSPDAIISFVHHMWFNWANPQPRYLFLVGEASYDYRDYLGELNNNVVPAAMVPVFYGGETVSDAELADVDGDNVPDMAVGRWPVSDPTEVESLVKRTLAYEQGQVPERVIFAADGTSAEFSSLSDGVLESSNLSPSTVDRLYGVSSIQLADAWNNGAWLVNYSGHGSLNRWGKEDIFSTESVRDLDTAGSPPIVVQLTCLTGFFAHPTDSSLSETMLLDPDGPVLVVAATSLTLSDDQLPFGAALIRELQSRDVMRAGDALQNAKLALDVSKDDSLREISDTFGLLGDPSTLLVRPSDGGQ